MPSLPPRLRDDTSNELDRHWPCRNRCGTTPTLRERIGRWALAGVAAAGLQGLELPDIALHGFVSQGYILTDDNNWPADSSGGTFEFNEVGLNVSAGISDSLHVGVQLFSRDFGALGDNQLTLDYAYADYHHRDWLGLRLGRFKVPRGFYNEYQDIDAGRTQILLPQSVYLLLFRDLDLAANGIQAYGLVPLAELGELEYQIFVGTVSLPDGNSIEYFLLDQGLEAGSMSADETFGGALTWNTPLDGLRARLSYTGLRGLQDDGSVIGTPFVYQRRFDDMDTWIASLAYQWERWLFSAEYWRMDADLLLRFPASPLPTIDRPVEPDGWYASVGYELHADWQLALTWSEYYADRNDRDGDDQAALGQAEHRGWQKDLALSVRYDVDEYWLLKAEIHVMDGTALLFQSENPDGLERDWWLLALKTTFTF